LQGLLCPVERKNGWLDLPRFSGEASAHWAAYFSN
jgi:hypothetical protein